MNLKSERPKKQTQSNVPKGWHRITLGQLVTFHRGYDLPRKDMVEGQYPVVGSNGIIGYHESFKAKGPGVAIGRSGNLGKPFFVDRNYWPHNTSLYVSEFHCSNPSFVYYFLMTQRLDEYNSGSAVPTLNRNHIQPIEVVVPEDIEEQKAIGKTLSNLDKKIEVNEQINRTLEAVGEAVFRRWFVDFEFPDEEGIPYKSSGGKMVYNGELKKEIPKEWKVGCIEDLCSSITNGGTPKRSESQYWNGNIAWFKTGELNDSPLIDSEEHITEDGLQNSACKLWDENTILMALYASPTVGRLGLLRTKATANQACSGLVAKKEVGFSFLFYTLFFKRNEFNSIAVGAAQQNINQQIVREAKTVIPPKSLLNSFNKLVDTLFDKQTGLIRQNQTLAQIRDSLLPRLMSGKIRVPITEDNIEVC
ncbi:restriction endonuclease subunit S [Candidatus Bathyarchaeota archaeon]|nr:restriction endonuclease subunit S [Candidatus Bathyarchaeota archaeon]